LIHAWRLPSFDAGVAIAVGLRRTGVRPACLELSADDAPGPATMLLVFDGLEGEAALLAARAAKLLATAGGTMLGARDAERQWQERHAIDRKSTRLNSSHVSISYAVFCLKKKKE